MKSNRVVLLVGGIFLVALGLVWTLQGVGVLGGSVMSGSITWALIGPVVAVAGIYLVIRWRRAA